MATQDVQCPVCNKYFSTGKINTHVNWCLSGENDRKEQAASKEVEVKECPVEEPKTKRLKMDDKAVTKAPAMHMGGVQNWGFMMKTKSISSPVKSRLKSEMAKPQAMDNLNHGNIDTGFSNLSKKRTHCFNKSETCQLEEEGSPLLNIHSNVPLAERMRPLTMSDYIGQEQAVGRKKLLRTLFEANRIPSMILWGPPGCGKVTLLNCYQLSVFLLLRIVADPEGGRAPLPDL